MSNQKTKAKLREWLKRYIPAETLGTIGALAAAWITFAHTHSYIVATGAGWVGEGIGFYGYFIVTELLNSTETHKQYRLAKRISLAIASAGANLIVEFAPAEVLDNFIIRPFLMFLVPHYIHPYPVGFLIGKFAADIVFYCFAVVGYEARKRWLKS